MSIQSHFCVSNLMMQPTTLCNLDCAYCYLPHRATKLQMDPVIASRVAQSLSEVDRSVNIIWHGGEPLVCGVKHFASLVYPFQDLVNRGMVRHAIQTNATLINNGWCDFFLQHQIRVGVSIDGPSWANDKRVNWSNDPAFQKIVEGIQFLVHAAIPFTAICVIHEKNLAHAAEIYEFFQGLGCSEVGFNIEEKLGVNERNVDDNEGVTEFWRNLFTAWTRNPSIGIREFRKILGWMQSVCNPNIPEQELRDIDVFPCVGFNGNVVLLSPEILSVNPRTYETFVVGNIQQELESGMGENWPSAPVRGFAFYQ